MSNSLKIYKSIESTKCMVVTATLQGDYGQSVQFTCGNNYCVLAENQVKDLIDVLKKRLKCLKGYSATDESVCFEVYPVAKEMKK